MDENMWWLYDALSAVVLIVFAVITVKRGLIKAIVSSIGFLLSVIIAISVSATLQGAMYGYAARSSNAKDINKTINENMLVEKMSAELEALDYNITVNQNQLKNTLIKSNDHEGDLYRFVNNINGRKVDTTERFTNKLHHIYGNIIRDIVGKEMNNYATECAAKKAEEDPQSFNKLIPLMLQPDESLMNASEYICDTYVNEPYRELLRMIALIALLAVGIIISLIAAITAGRNEKMEPGFTRHLFCGILGLFKGVAVIFGIAVIIRLSAILGTNRELMFSYPAIEHSYAFKYVYDFVCGLK